MGKLTTWICSSRVNAVFTARRLPWLLALLAILVMAPSLFAGYYQDDHLIRVRFQDFSQLPGIEGRLLDTCTFGDGNPEQNEARMELGMAPWWTDPEWKISFGRPLIGLSHYIDWLLVGDNPVFMHAHNILWYALLVILITLLYRRLINPAWAAGLAALMFVIDDSHAIPVGWIATRNAPLSSVFIVLVIYFHDRWRRDAWKPGQWLALLSLGVGLAGSEATIASGAYLAAHALFIDQKGSVVKRFVRLLPYLAVVIVWRVIYDAYGYGVHATMLYTDPITQPSQFIQDLAHYLPLLLFGLFGIGDPAIGVFLPQPLNAVALVVVVAALAFMAYMFWPLLKRDAQARFWATGMLLSALPICTTIPQLRELMNPSIGGLALIALFVANALERAPSPSKNVGQAPSPVVGRSRFVTALATIFILFHVVLSMVSMPVLAYTGTVMPESIARRIVKTAPTDNNYRTLVVAYAPADLISAVLPIMRAAEKQHVPTHTRTLCAGVRSMQMERTDDRTLVVRPDGTFLTQPFSQIFRNPMVNPMNVGDTIKLTDMQATIDQVSPDGRPKQITFRFDVPLEDPSLRWVVYGKDGEYAPFTPPPVGQSIEITGPSISDMAKSWFLGKE